MRLLSDELLARIVSEARDNLCKLGTQVQNPRVLKALAGFF